MQDQPTLAPVTVSRNGVCVIDGYSIRIRVERGHLHIADGIGPERRQSRFSRPTAGIRRIVLLGHTGYVTLEALRWMQDVGIGFIHLGPDGRLLAASAAIGVDEPALRRAQAMAWGSTAGLDIARGLLRDKLGGQIAVAGSLPDGDAIARRIESQVPLLESAADQRALMIVEAAAASEYWRGWSGLPIPWARRDAALVPEHWRVFTSRTSPLTSSPRRAADPANALINYVQSLVEAEARLACLAIGLDPGLGVLHADQRARDSLCLDIQEVVRPEADAFVLQLLEDSVFRTSDFVEGRDGSVRVLPPLATWLSETVVRWRVVVAPVVERLALELASSATSRVRLATKLTEANRSAGRRTGHRPKPSTMPRQRRRSCGECGAPVPGKRKVCDECLPTRREELNSEFAARLREHQRELHRAGAHPSHSVEAQRSRGRRIAEHERTRREWERANPQRRDAESFRTEILPRLRQVSIARITAATGLSASYCSAIRNGVRTPHPRWWKVLDRLASEEHGAG